MTSVNALLIRQDLLYEVVTCAAALKQHHVHNLSVAGLCVLHMTQEIFSLMCQIFA